MFTFLLRILGVTPDGAHKSGKREAAWAVVIIALGLTLTAMWFGVEMVQSLQAVLISIWPSAIGFVGFAYKLQNDKTKAQAAASRPDGYPADVAPPEEWEPPDGRVG